MSNAFEHFKYDKSEWNLSLIFHGTFYDEENKIVIECKWSQRADEVRKTQSYKRIVIEGSKIAAKLVLGCAAISCCEFSRRFMLFFIKRSIGNGHKCNGNPSAKVIDQRLTRTKWRWEHVIIASAKENGEIPWRKTVENPSDESFAPQQTKIDFPPSSCFNPVQSKISVAGENVCKFSSLVSLMQYARVVFRFVIVKWMNVFVGVCES